MSRDYQEQFLREQIAEYDQLLVRRRQQDATRAHRNLIKTIEKQKARREERLKDLLAEDKKDDGLVFDELGVDHLFIDEAHYFKNLETPTKMERVAGIQTGGSERFDLYMKARYLHEHTPATASRSPPARRSPTRWSRCTRCSDSSTPRGSATRHRAFRRLGGHVRRGGGHDGDLAGRRHARAGKPLRPVHQPARTAADVPRPFADVQTAEMLDLPRPRLEGGKPIVVACPMSEEQHALQQELVARYERLRSQKKLNPGRITVGHHDRRRKLALDARMLSATAPDFPGSKVNALVENVAPSGSGRPPRAARR